MTGSAAQQLAGRVKALGGELGFARVGIARAEPLGVEAERLRAWLDAGRHGTMAYMERTAAVRSDPTHPGMLPDARSVVVLAMPYAAPAARAGAGVRVAHYAKGRDYHNALHRRLRPLVSLLRAEGHAARAAVDSMPVFERAFAQRAGIGFIGKNCCLIVPGIGSHVFLAAVVTTAELACDAPMRERCGECRLCLERCPTRAFAAPRELDARRCISYLTIEHRGAIDPELRESMGEWVFGCDACQDVCPFNRAAAMGASSEEPTAIAAMAEREPERLLQLSDDEFASVAQGSPLRRAKREGMARNAAIALGNARPRRALPVLRHAAASDPSPVVRDTARWALERFRSEPG